MDVDELEFLYTQAKFMYQMEGFEGLSDEQIRALLVYERLDDGADMCVAMEAFKDTREEVIQELVSIYHYIES